MQKDTPDDSSSLEKLFKTRDYENFISEQDMLEEMRNFLSWDNCLEWYRELDGLLDLLVRSKTFDDSFKNQYEKVRVLRNAFWRLAVKGINCHIQDKEQDVRDLKNLIELIKKKQNHVTSD